MKLFEVAVEYHDELCPKLWDGLEMKEEVRDQLLAIADNFAEYLDTPFEPDDIVVTGSMANYNWTNKSDIDLHLIIDLDEYKKNCPDYAEDFFSNKKTLWNEHYDVQIYGHPVEIYVQDDEEVHMSSGVYSVLTGEWVVQPEHVPPASVDEQAIKLRADEFKEKIDKLTGSSGNSEEANELKDEIRLYRKSGLESDDAEFSVPNLVFKELRKSGHMGKLVDYIRDDLADELSL
jgi:hypothetical protein